MEFYVGIHQPADAGRVPRCMVSVARLRRRRSDFPTPPAGWLLDSGAFSELYQHGAYRDDPGVYAAQVRRWAGCGRLLAAASQDYMCEPHILRRTGLDIAAHQRLTIERYDAIRALVPATYILPVLQGYLPEQYAAHIAQYGARLRPGMWVGVGSVCKRNGSPRDVAGVLRAIKAARPDLRLHGFGLKLTALQSDEVRAMLHSADSMAWSYAARRDGRDANSWREALDYYDRVTRPRPRALTPLEELWAA